MLLTFRATALALLSLAILPAAAGAHGTAPHGVSEKRLRAFEQRVLGPEHAAEHASRRALVRSKKGRAALRRLRRRERTVRPLARMAAASNEGSWAGPYQLPVFGIHTTMLPTGKVLFFSYDFFKGPRELSTENNTATAYVWDPVTKTSKSVPPPLWTDPATGKTKPVNIWCGGQSLTADGQVLVTGGTLAYNDGEAGKTYAGLNKVYTFDPFTETWTEQPDMRGGRWYPTQTLLPDGRTLIMSGDNESGTLKGGAPVQNLDMELFTPAPTRGGRGTITLLGKRSAKPTADVPPTGGLYPHVFAMPSGRALVAGPYPEDSWLLDPFGPSTLWTDVANEADAAGAPVSRYAGNAVLLPSADGRPSTRVMHVGGGGDDPLFPDPHRSSAIFDEARQADGWKTGPSMNTGRSHQNTVLLPDGGMVAVGGGYGDRAPLGQWMTGPEHRAVELYEPATGSWRLGAAQQEGRAYHSTALLLPDGRVLSAGDDINGSPNGDTAEIYEPPYLHSGPRPTITSAPEGLMWNDGFRVGTPDAVTRAVLMAPGAVTHANDMSQRHVELEVTGRASGQGVDLRAPANANAAPPGYYMLFVLENGIPSVARWVRLGVPTSPPGGTTPPSPPGGTTPPSPPGGTTAPSPPGGTATPAAPRGTTSPDAGRAATPAAPLRVKLRVLRPRLAHGRLQVVGTVNRGATVRMTARIGRSTGRLVAQRSTVYSKAGTRTLTLRLSGRARRSIAASRSRRLVVTVFARDAAGATAVARASVSV